MGGAGAVYEAFLRACTKTGIFGFLAAFIAGFLAYGLALAAATILLKWLLVQQMQAGVHKCAASHSLPCLKPRPCASAWMPIGQICLLRNSDDHSHGLGGPDATW